MKSIYLRNFLATALLVFVSFAIVGASFFFIGRNYLINSTAQTRSSDRRLLFQSRKRSGAGICV